MYDNSEVNIEGNVGNTENTELQNLASMAQNICKSDDEILTDVAKNSNYKL